jgi:hypothetical protein
VIFVLRFTQPPPLTCSLAGQTASGLIAELLAPKVEGSGLKNFLAVMAFHRSRKKIQHRLQAGPDQRCAHLRPARKRTKKEEEILMKGAKKTKKTPRKNTAFSNRPFYPVFKPPRALNPPPQGH